LQSLNKRKRPSSQGAPSDHEKTNPTSTVDSTVKNKERKRLKKMRKDKLRLQSSPDHAQDSFAATNMLERKHKKKHKCQDDLCKHRKHKKRRKHKKHHHRELDEEDRDLQHHVQSAMSISNDSNNNEEEFEEDSMSLNESVTQYEIVKKVGEDMVIKDDPDTMESSVTESSGSVYVSYK
jgi:sporulation protein YlmC with PRC-barrel domain